MKKTLSFLLILSSALAMEGSRHQPIAAEDTTHDARSNVTWTNISFPNSINCASSTLAIEGSRNKPITVEDATHNAISNITWINISFPNSINSTPILFSPPIQSETTTETTSELSEAEFWETLGALPEIHPNTWNKPQQMGPYSWSIDDISDFYIKHEARAISAAPGIYKLSQEDSKKMSSLCDVLLNKYFREVNDQSITKFPLKFIVFLSQHAVFYNDSLPPEEFKKFYETLHAAIPEESLKTLYSRIIAFSSKLDHFKIFYSVESCPKQLFTIFCHSAHACTSLANKLNNTSTLKALGKRPITTASSKPSKKRWSSFVFKL